MFTPMSERTDEELMEALQAGDDLALTRLMERWEVPTKRFLLRLVGNLAEAEDLAQDVFVRIYQKRASYRKGARFTAWLFTIAANQARNRLRWWKRRPLIALHEWVSEGGDREDESASTSTLEHSEAVASRIASVQRAIMELPLDERTALVLFEYEDKSMTEIASIVGGTPKAVENRLYRARKALSKILISKLDRA
jgi:RNA polymerase sigma-70 factor (ECF subfamily)